MSGGVKFGWLFGQEKEGLNLVGFLDRRRRGKVWIFGQAFGQKEEGYSMVDFLDRRRRGKVWLTFWTGGGCIWHWILGIIFIHKILHG